MTSTASMQHGGPEDNPDKVGESPNSQQRFGITYGKVAGILQARAAADPFGRPTVHSLVYVYRPVLNCILERASF